MTGNLKCVGVIGTGVIGASWTALFLAHGLQVLVSDPAPDAEKALAEHIKRAWPTLQELGLSEGASMENYRFVGPSLEKYYGEVDFIQENAPERWSIKTKLIGEIDAGARPDVVIASSSSGLPSSQFIGECKKNPARVLIGHPFNPPHLMPLVEVVPHPGTSSEATNRAMEIYKGLGKSPVLLKKEVPGFAANRLQAALCTEAYSLVARRVLSSADVGPRWALPGPFMGNVSGGGGIREGFAHLLRHIGPASDVWLEDMAKHRYQFTEENLALLDNSVQQQLDVYDPKVVEEQRDALLIRLLKDKASASAIV